MFWLAISRPNLVTHLSMKTLPSQPSALLCLPLREELMGTARQLHHLARDSTLRIRDCLPLGTAVDNPSHYLACISPAAGDAQHEEDTATTVALPTLRVRIRKILVLTAVSSLCLYPFRLA